MAIDLLLWLQIVTFSRSHGHTHCVYIYCIHTFFLLMQIPVYIGQFRATGIEEREREQRHGGCGSDMTQVLVLRLQYNMICTPTGWTTIMHIPDYSGVDLILLRYRLGLIYFCQTAYAVWTWLQLALYSDYFFLPIPNIFESLFQNHSQNILISFFMSRQYYSSFRECVIHLNVKSCYHLQK